MIATFYGIRVVRGPIPSLVDAIDRDQGRPGTLQFWKSWPDGSSCKMLEIRAEEVPSDLTASVLAVAGGPVLGAEVSSWKELRIPGSRYTFDPEQDWWVAPPNVGLVVMRTSESPKESVRMVTAAPRRPV